MYIIIYIIYILVVFPWVYENPHPYPPKPVPMDAGTGFGGYGCRLPWKTPGLPVTFPTDLLHEFELGVFKAIFAHLLRIVYTCGDNKIQILNHR
jgi:hypothetical protein